MKTRVESSAIEDPQRISSSSTTFWKRVFTPIWVAFFGGITLAGWTGHLDGELSRGGLFALTGISLGLGTYFVYWSQRLEHVWLVGNDLLVLRNGRRRRIPIQDVREISETRWSKVKTVTVKLRPGSPAGSTIRFLPPFRLLTFLGHPLVRELNRKKDLLRSGSSSSPKRP